MTAVVVALRIEIYLPAYAGTYVLGLKVDQAQNAAGWRWLLISKVDNGN